MKVIDKIKHLFKTEELHDFDIKNRKLIARGEKKYYVISCKNCEARACVPIEQDLTKLPEDMLKYCNSKYNHDADKD